MKARHTLTVLALFIPFFIFTSCAMTNARLKLSEQDGKSDCVTVELTSPHLASPLRIGYKQGIYLRTANETIYVKGESNAQSQANGQQVWTWLLDDQRQVSVAIDQHNGSYTLKLSAEPNKDIIAWGFSVDAQANEYFTGLFERTVDGNQIESWKEGITEAMNLRGQAVDMLIKPTLGLYCPFYLSSRGYSIFTEGTWPGHYDFCKSDSDVVQIEFEGPNLSVVIDTADKCVDLVKKHSLRVGPTIVPPQRVFRPQRCGNAHKNLDTYYDGTPVKAPYNSQFVEDVLMMEGYGIPCGVCWVDRPWATGKVGYDDFNWDDKRFPEARKMIEWMHGKQMKVLLWIAPWVSGQMATTAVEKGYVLKNQKSLSGTGSLIDFTNPQARTWWQQEGLRKVLEDGIDGFKMDRAEEVVSDDREHTVYDGRTNREYKNHFPVDYVEAAWQIAKEVRGDDFVLIPRAAYTGSSRYGVFWGGDIGSPPEGLRCAIIAQLRSALIGYPIWGSDTAGYRHGDKDREISARWFGFSCFSPIMEVGPTNDRGFWDKKIEPSYDVELIAIWRLYAILHDQLADYSYACAKEAAATGMPIARPLFLQWPDQKQCWEDWQTFMYGPDILVSAIWQKGKDSHTFYLPAGTEWVDAWEEDKVYKGGQSITVQTPMHKIPIFIRKGADLELPDLNALYDESIKIAAKKPDLDMLQKAEFGVK